MKNRLLALALLLAASIALAASSHAASGVRTLVVRGRIARADGAPAALARVNARGAMSVSATADDRGRYSITMPMGSPAALRTGAFRAEVRAEEKGHKLALASGAPALLIEVAFVPGTTRLRVRSNSPAATAAVITAFAQEGIPTAWVDADFGGAVRATSSLEMSAVDEVTLTAIAPAPAGADPLREPKRAAAATPIAAKPAPKSRPVVAVTPPTPAPPRSKPASKPVVVATPPAAVTPRRKPAATNPPPVVAPAPAPPMAVVPTIPVTPPARRPAPPRVVTIEPFAPPPAAEPADTCACRLRGTVEVDWERPLEKDFPVELTLEGPARQSTSVDLFMGPPREFRLGPLPCGDYRLTVKARGKYRYALVRGDSAVTIHCAGHTQSRVVLEPVKR